MSRFGRMAGDFKNNLSTIDINGGKSFSYEWYDIHTPLGNVGVKYYRSTPQIDIQDIIRFQMLPWIGITIIVIIVIVRKKRNKRELEEKK